MLDRWPHSRELRIYDFLDSDPDPRKAKLLDPNPIEAKFLDPDMEGPTAL